MVILQYWNGKKWSYVSTHQNEMTAWISLGDDYFNYRTMDEQDNVLTDKSVYKHGGKHVI